MELRHLRYFVAAAEELHFGRAAKRVNIAQPALTKQIQSLEADLGTRLFCRSKRRVELTDAGRRLLADARPLLEHARQVEDVANRVGQGEVGRLAVGFTPVALYGALPPILRAFRERMPDVDLTVDEQWTPEVVRAIVSKRLDAGVVRLPLDADLATFPLRSDPLVVALPADHPLARYPSLILSDLEHDRFILFPRHLRPDFHDDLMRLCREAGFTPRIGQEATTEPTMVGLVAAGLGITLVPAAYRMMERPDVVYRPLTEPVAIIETVLAWRRDDPSAVLQAFLAVAREIASRPDPALSAMVPRNGAGGGSGRSPRPLAMPELRPAVRQT